MEGAIISATRGAVASLLCKLGGLIADEVWLLHGVRREMQYIKDELESMSAFLENLAASSEKHNSQVRIWVKQVREIAYDAEDCIDEFARHLPQPSRNVLHRLVRTLRTLGSRRRIAVQLQELKARARDVAERRARYVAEPTEKTVDGHGSARHDHRLDALFMEEAQLVGIDGPRDELAAMLTKDEPQLRVLSIVGLGGLGKTTLARIACGSTAVRGADFQSSLLVTVSPTFSTKTLLQDTLRELILRRRDAMATAGRPTDEQIREDTLEGMEGWKVEQLTEKIQQHLQDKRYIVILDDIWTISAWESIRYAFPENNKGSRILVTTRHEDVADCCSSSQDWIYKIQPLSKTSSRDLFSMRIFGSKDIPLDDELVKVSDSICAKCGGLPLAIMSIVSLLARKPSKVKEEWEKVSRYLGSELETNLTLERAKEALALSYNALPYHLKTCFLYLSIFPESCVIKRGPLVRQWIAEGLVSPRRGLCMELVADSYFDEFVNRSIVQPVRIDWSDKVRSCRVHGIMLEVIISKSLEENFATLLCDEGSTLVTHDKIRRLSLQSSHSVQITISSVAHVRSFTMSASCEEVPFFFPQLRLLRVLDMQGCSCLSTNHLDSICKFLQLRYLRLRNTNVSKLPRLLGNLKLLETLDIRATRINKLPASAANLKRLKHLLAGHKVVLTRTSSVKFLATCLEVAPGMVKNMTALQQLLHIVVRNQPSVLQEVGLLQKLRKLNVIFRGVEENWKHFLESLGKLAGSLHSLSIEVLEEKESNHSLDMLTCVERPPLSISSLSLTGQLSSLPPWFALLRNVSRLCLRHTELGAGAMVVLGNLPNVQCLKLYHRSYSDSRIVFQQGMFKHVRLLIIDNLVNIEKVHFEEGSLPELERLSLSFVQDPKDGVSGLENLHKLKEIEFYGRIIETTARKVASYVKTYPNPPRVIGDTLNVVREYS